MQFIVFIIFKRVDEGRVWQGEMMQCKKQAGGNVCAFLQTTKEHHSKYFWVNLNRMALHIKTFLFVYGLGLTFCCTVLPMACNRKNHFCSSGTCSYVRTTSLESTGEANFFPQWPPLPFGYTLLQFHHPEVDIHFAIPNQLPALLSHYHCLSQTALSLSRDLAKFKRFRGKPYQFPWPTEKRNNTWHFSSTSHVQHTSHAISCCPYSSPVKIRRRGPNRKRAIFKCVPIGWVGGDCVWRWTNTWASFLPFLRCPIKKTAGRLKCDWK